MGVVHLARRPGGERVALKVLRPHIVGDDEIRARLAREVSSLSRVRSRWVAEIVDSDPWGDIPYVATRYVPGLSLQELVQEEGPIEGRRPALVRTRPGRGARDRARGRGAAPRREAVERADGGPQPDPDRLRPGPGRRRPEAHPHRLAAGHARLPRPRDPARRRRDRRLRHPLLGGHRHLRRHRTRRRSGAARRWRSWTGSAAGSTTCPGCPATCARWSTPRSTPTRRVGRPCPQLLEWLRAEPGRVPPPGACADRRERPLHRPAGARLAGARPDDHDLRRRAGGRHPPLRRRPLGRSRSGEGPGRAEAPAGTLLVTAAVAVGAAVAAYPWLATASAPARRLGAAQRLAGRQRHRRPAPAARGEVVRPGALSRRRPVARRALDPRHPAAGAVEPRPRHGGGADLLRRGLPRSRSPCSRPAWCSWCRSGSARAAPGCAARCRGRSTRSRCGSAPGWPPRRSCWRGSVRSASWPRRTAPTGRPTTPPRSRSSTSTPPAPFGAVTGPDREISARTPSDAVPH